ncbi:MAG: glycosyltransferase [Thermoplasmata archaeon]
MESESRRSAFLSVVVTVRNEAPYLARLLDSLIRQSPPLEIIVVDAESRDATFTIAESYALRAPGLVRVLRRASSRGEGRNIGVDLARGEFVAFTDGDCCADPGWLDAMRQGFREGTIVAGRTVPMSPSKFGALERVELYLEGSDVTYPSCNLGYSRDLFRRLGGFDPRFITAEDIDLNLRAVREGATIHYAPDAVIRHLPRTSWPAFLRQAFWNGYGRKQLTEKHGQLWSRYRIERLAADQHGAVALLRLGAAVAGYLARVLTGAGERLGRATP